MNILIYGIKGYMGNIIRELAEKDDYFKLVHGRDIDFREESSEKYDIINSEGKLCSCFNRNYRL